MNPFRLPLRLGIVSCLLLWSLPAEAQSTQARPRARDLGITFGGQSGRNNAITDVSGVEVGHTTLISGDTRGPRGKGAVRTGVTAVLPRGKNGVSEDVFAAIYALNGNGEMTGSHWLTESGQLAGPVMLTNTNDVGTVRDSVIAWAMKRGLEWELGLPIVAETWDGLLNDIYGFHVKATHAHRALDSAKSGPVAEGSVGGGTGMVCHSFKAGIGTASRKLPESEGGYTVGVLLQCNYGARHLFTVEGVPVGEEINDLRPCYTGPKKPSPGMFKDLPACSASRGDTQPRTPEGAGSIIVVVATDAPLLPHQLERLAKRVPLGIGKMGGLGGNSSGDIFVAFSTQRLKPPAGTAVASVSTLDNERMTPLFEATIQATQEAILNSMLASDTMTGAEGSRAFGLPQERLIQVMKKHGRLTTAAPAP
ncbi:aminopeptidase [Myxococcus xanthus]|uniref:DmpA family aminopeptidase n=1 Tax=Myxococcus xanthus TaxID=34 RepID=UPI0011298D24|nr:P1 family peptidase [Myxococcus xanthus]QDE89775.1 aminopeptidase [Myxococcus xanthus]